MAPSPDGISPPNVLRVSGARALLLVSLQLTEVRWTRLLGGRSRPVRPPAPHRSPSSHTTAPTAVNTTPMTAEVVSQMARSCCSTGSEVRKRARQLKVSSCGCRPSRPRRRPAIHQSARRRPSSLSPPKKTPNDTSAGPEPRRSAFPAAPSPANRDRPTTCASINPSAKRRSACASGRGGNRRSVRPSGTRGSRRTTEMAALATAGEEQVPVHACPVCVHRSPGLRPTCCA